MESGSESATYPSEYFLNHMWNQEDGYIARERESGQVTKIFSKILIISYNGDIPNV